MAQTWGLKDVKCRYKDLCAFLLCHKMNSPFILLEIVRRSMLYLGDRCDNPSNTHDHFLLYLITHYP